MKIKGISNFNDQLKRFKGRFQVYGLPDGSLVVCKWPRKRPGYYKGPTVDQTDTFRQVVYWASHPMAADVISAMSAGAATPYYIRDMIEAACYGTLLTASDANGNVVLGKRMVSGTTQAMLDSVTSTPGSVLYRGPSGWVGLSPGEANQVLTINQGTLFPDWETPSPPNAPGTLMAAQPYNNNLSSGANATKGNVFTMQTDVDIYSLMKMIPGADFGSYFPGIYKVSGTSANPTISSVVVGPSVTTTAQSNDYWMRMAFGAPEKLLAGSTYFIAGTITTGTGSTNLAQRTSTTYPGNPAWPGVAIWQAVMAEIAPAIGDTVHTTATSSGLYVDAYEWAPTT